MSRPPPDVLLALGCIALGLLALASWLAAFVF